METIINVSTKKVLGLFYQDYFRKIHLREICRKTNLNANSVSRILNKLVKENLIESEKKGNMKDYFLRNNKKTHAFLSVFDSEKFEILPKIRKKAINLFLSELDERPLIVILFGSSAKGNFVENSDIDLFLVVNEKIITEKAKDYSESQTGIEINPFQIKLNEFELELKLKEDKVLQSAIKSGYPLENGSLFYEKVLK